MLTCERAGKATARIPVAASLPILRALTAALLADLFEALPCGLVHRRRSFSGPSQGKTARRGAGRL